MAYNGTIDLISGIRAKNNGNFPLVDAADIRVNDSTRLDAKLSSLEAIIAELAAGEETIRELTSSDCFSDTEYMVGANGSIYISSSAPSIYNGPYTHLGIRATELHFTHDFVIKGSSSDPVWIGIVVNDDLFVGYPVSEKTSYMRAFTSGGSQTSFSDGMVVTQSALASVGTYTIDVLIEDNSFTIKEGNNVIFEMTVGNGVQIKGIGVVRFGIPYSALLYNCTILPMAVEDEEDNVTPGSSIPAEYYLKGASSKAARTKKLCIIGAGQSNIDGFVPIADLPSGYSLPMSGMKYIKNQPNGTFSSSYPSVSLWSFDVVLCKYLIDNLGSDNLYYIKWSEGGTSIDPSYTGKAKHWTADYEQLPDIANSLLYSFETEIRKCEEVNPGEYEIRAMIWHQGESDSARGSLTAPKNYYANLKKVIAYCRGVVGNARLPFIFGTVAHNNTDYDETIEAAMQAIAEEDPYVWLVDMSDAELMVESGDGWTAQWHFNAAWSEYMGKKYYDCLIDAGVISGAKLNPTKPAASE